MSTDRDAFFGPLPKGTIMFCIHCCRTYPYGEYRTESVDMGKELYQICPYDGCSGDAVIDAVEWSEIREDNPDYPEIPERGVEYP